LVFDVGAHVGDRTAAFAALGARVVALEPQPHVRSLLLRLVGRNDRVTVRPEAVGQAAGRATLAISRRSPTVSTLAQEWKHSVASTNPSFENVAWEDSVEVSVTTMDALIERYGMPRFCKIDVEGHEADVLLGLNQPVPALSVEFVAGSLHIAMACVDRLSALGSYGFNAALGESRRYALPQWVDGPAMSQWLHAGAGGASSGDLYARLES